MGAVIEKRVYADPPPLSNLLHAWQPKQCWDLQKQSVFLFSSAFSFISMFVSSSPPPPVVQCEPECCMSASRETADLKFYTSSPWHSSLLFNRWCPVFYPCHLHFYCFIAYPSLSFSFFFLYSVMSICISSLCFFTYSIFAIITEFLPYFALVLSVQ